MSKNNSISVLNSPNSPIKSGTTVSLDNDIAELNERYAFVSVGSKARIVDEYGNQTNFIEQRAFIAKYANRPSNNTTVGDYWLSHSDRRQYINGVVFDPSNNEAEGQYNLWKGFSAEPDSNASCRRFLWHLLHIICSGDQDCNDYVLDWLGLLVQRPHQLPGTAICLLSPPGTGKGLWMQYLSKIIDRHYIHITSTEQLTGRFTGHLETAVLIFADEVYATGDRKALGQLKTLITEPKRTLERKGIDATQVNNCAHLVMASNDEKAISAEVDDRRYFILGVSALKQGDRDYFKELLDEMDDRGPNALISHLMDRDITNFNPSKFPITNARVNQQLQSLNPIERWLYEELSDGLPVTSHPVFRTKGTLVPKDIVNTKYMAWHKLYYSYSPETKTQLTKTLKKFGIITKRDRGVSVPADQQQCYDFPDLPKCRKSFESYLGSSVSWPVP